MSARIKPLPLPDYFARRVGPRFYESTYRGRRERKRGPCGHLGRLTWEVIHARATKLDRLTVTFSTSDDSPHNDTLLAFVKGPKAEEWADSDGSIGGSSWEKLSDTSVYAMPSNHPGLVAELREYGYKLDLSGYEEVISDCEECGCEDPECGWKSNDSDSRESFGIPSDQFARGED